MAAGETATGALSQEITSKIKSEAHELLSNPKPYAWPAPGKNDELRVDTLK